LRFELFLQEFLLLLTALLQFEHLLLHGPNGNLVQLCSLLTLLAAYGFVLLELVLVVYKQVLGVLLQIELSLVGACLKLLFVLVFQVGLLLLEL